MNEFDDITDLDDVFGPLRSAAQPAELSQEKSTVDLMVKARCNSEGKSMFTSRRARIATLVAAGVLGFGGMAAASESLTGVDLPEEPAVLDEPAEEEVDAPAEADDETEVDDETEGVEETEADDETEAGEEAERPEAEVEGGDEELVVLEDDPETDFNEAFCEPGNHGKTVSAVARGEYTLGDAPDEVTVREAAHSSCGKASGAKPDKVEEFESESEVESEESVSKPERPGKSDKGAERAVNGKSNGNGNGKSNGKRGG